MKRIAFLAAVVLAVSMIGSIARATVSVSIATTRTLTGATSFSFSSNVRTVRSDNVVLRKSGSTTNLSARLACKNSSGAGVSCSSSTIIRKALLTPSAPLIPGQIYSAIVNPPGATPITDGSTAIPTRTSSFRASMVEEETSAIAVARWRSVSASGAYDGSVVMERTAGATASFSFTGSSLYWYTRTGPDQGKADVYVDGALKRTFDNFSATTTEKVRRAITGLSSARHRATIRVRGESRAPGGGTWIVLDAFAQAGRMFSPAITYRWARPSVSGASGGRVIASDARSTMVDFRFRGKGIDWYTVTGPDQGRAEVYVDGALRETVDNYSASRVTGVRRSVAGLTDAEHTLRIRVLGTKSSAASRALVFIDRWVVRYPSIAAFKKLGAWIDLYDYGIDIPTAVANMRARGVKTLYVQTARYTTTETIADPVKLGQWIDEARARGIKVIGWYFPAYGDNLDEDLQKLRAIVTFRSPGGYAMDGMGIDIEHVSSPESYRTTREEFNAGIKTLLPRARRVAGNTYPIASVPVSPLHMDLSPSSWSGFPWSTLGRYTDVVMPMAYWPTYCARFSSEASGECPRGYAEQNVERSRVLTGLPVHPIGGVGDRITTAELDRFVTGARAGRGIGCSIYDYRTTSTAFWTPLARCNGF